MTTATQNRAVAKMTEQQLLDCVIETAHVFGWRVAHFRPAMTKHGWRTPVSADGAGWPDLTMVRDSRIIFAELKSARGQLTDDQVGWLAVLANVGETAVWYPQDWTDGSIEKALRP